MPTERLLRIVESKETRIHFTASVSLVEPVMTRSMSVALSAASGRE
jgi:hypothetical protein